MHESDGSLHALEGAVIPQFPTSNALSVVMGSFGGVFVIASSGQVGVVRSHGTNSIGWRGASPGGRRRAQRGEGCLCTRQIGARLVGC